MEKSAAVMASDVFAIDEISGELTISEPAGGGVLLRARKAEFFRPVLDGEPIPLSITGIEISDQITTIRYDGEGLAGMTVSFSLEDGGRALDCVCSFQVLHDTQLNALDLFPTDTELNLYEVINFRNRHHAVSTWPELLIGDEMQTTTYSNDWQFAPHPTAWLFNKNRHSLFAGFLDLQASFGMQLSAAKGKVKCWRVDFGERPHGLLLSAGEVFRSARLRLFVREDMPVYDIYSEFGLMLVDEGSIPSPVTKRRESWWREPLYCTWNDQRMLANYQAEVELADQTADKVLVAVEQLNESLVRRAVAAIRREGLPIRTILLDEGWSVTRGDWRPHPVRFPNIRGLVDELHEQGFKVMVWWNWAEIAPNADVSVDELAGGGWSNRHGHRWRDYSDPRIQEGYLKPLMRKLFSSDPDCYDLDGAKTDFLADKVHPDTPLTNPTWRGEERYFLRISELFYQEMCRHKPDAFHLGCAGNYWLSPFIDLNRTYDVHSSNWREHEERARMLICTCPGVPVSYDMHEYNESLDEYFHSARTLGASVELGNVLVSRESRISEVRPADQAFFDLLRHGCEVAKIG